MQKVCIGFLKAGESNFKNNVMTNVTSYILLSIGFLVLFFIGELLLKYFKFRTEYSRKFSHIASGLLACVFPYAFDSHWWVMAICLSFLLLLFLSMKFNFLKGINSVERKTYGSVFYPIAIYLCFILNEQLIKEPGQYYFYFTSVLILVFSDPMAALVGQNFPIYRFQKFAKGKSIGGSIAFFIPIFIILFLLLPFENIFLICLLISLLTTFIELISSRGFDNLFIPLMCYLVFWILL